MLGLSPEEVSALLSERYAADKETILHALAETVEQVNCWLCGSYPQADCS